MTIGSCRRGEGRPVVAESQRGFPAEAIERLGLQSSLSAYSVEKLMVFRVLDHRVNGSRLDFIERH